MFLQVNSTDSLEVIKAKIDNNVRNSEWNMFSQCLYNIKKTGSLAEKDLLPRLADRLHEVWFGKCYERPMIFP